MIEVRDLHKQLGAFALRGAGLRIEDGEYFVVLGPTGAGKTVLIECIAGLHRQERGEVWIDGREVTALAPELRNVGYVPQDYVLFPHMTLGRNIAFSPRLGLLPAAEVTRRVHELADMLHISHLLDRRPRTLSGGEQQRGALARALAPQPTVLLLDEPLSALDEGTRAELSDELSGLSRNLSTTIIHVCHNFEEALQLADRIAIIRQGQVVQVGKPADVFRRPNSPFVARFVAAENLLPVRSADRATSVVTLADGLRLAAATVPGGDDLLAMIRPEEVVIRRGLQGVAGSNTFAAAVQAEEDRGRTIRIHLAGPVPLLAVMTPQAYRELGVSPGQQVQVHCPPEAVHLIVRDGD